MMTVGSLFAGIGGMELGLEMTGAFETRWQVEIEPFCQKVLAKHWPNALRFSDVRDVGAHNLSPVDLICGGFPCQDISNAGTTHEGGLQGLEGSRSGLWYEFARIIRELEPRWVVIENVGALTSRGLETVLWQMAALGYDAEGQVLSAGAVGAPHLRKRLFTVGQRKVRRADELPPCDLCGEPYCGECQQHFADCEHHGLFDFLQDADSEGLEGDVGSILAQPDDWRSDAHAARSTWWGAQPAMDRNSDGLPGRLDRGGVVSGPTPEGGLAKVLPTMPVSNGAQANQWQAGGSQCISASEVLQSRVHGGCLCQRCALARLYPASQGEEDAWGLLRILWGYDTTPCSPSRLERAEQFAREHSDLVRELSYLLPPPCTACWTDSTAGGGRFVDETGRLSLAGYPKRKQRLQALGNAVCPQMAYFIGQRILASEGGGTR